jgi:hypothetical protein
MIEELKFCLHIHTHYSDGNAYHQKLVEYGQKAGLHGIITTDHNIWLDGIERYYGEGKKKFMLLVGEEIHDRSLNPPGNHLLAIGAMKELAPYSQNPQRLINQINRNDGLSFLAHPIEDPLSMFGEKDFSWRNWEVKNFNGIELWNQLSEFKSVSDNLLSVVINAIFPKRMTTGPLDRTLALWDDIIKKQKRPIVGVGGVDAHNLIKRFGPIKIRLYPYIHHFKSVTTHLLLHKPLTGSFSEDKAEVINALRSGHCFVAYDLPAPTDGFRFSVHNDDGNFIMGDQVKIKGGLTFQIRLPQRTLCRLLKDGKMIREWSDRNVCTYITTEPGVYRVETFIPYKGKIRGWIFSNPIYAWL